MFTTKDKLQECRRELSMRRRVYPKLVEAGRMSAFDSTRQIALLTAIKEDYEQKLADEAKAQHELF